MTIMWDDLKAEAEAARRARAAAEDRQRHAVLLPNSAPGWDEDPIRQLLAERSAEAASPESLNLDTLRLELLAHAPGGGGSGA